MKTTPNKIFASSTVISILLVVVVVAAAAVSFWAFREIETAAEARKHTFIAINRANILLSELKDAETGQRGYTLTGDEAFLEPYLAVRGNVNGHLKQLRQPDLSSAAQKHLDALMPLIDGKIAELTKVIELRRNNKMNAALEIVSSKEGKQLMDSIRAEMHSFIQIQEVALTQDEAKFQSNMLRLFTIIVSATVFTLLFAFWFAYLIYQQTQQRLKNIVHLETRHLLEIQEETNKQLQQVNVALAESQERLLVTLNSIGDAVIATDAEGRVTLLNPLSERLTGWTQAEAIGHPVEEILHVINQQTRQPIAIPIKQALATGEIQSMTNHTVLIARGGGECIIADSCAPIRNFIGNVVGAVLVFRDVTKDYAAKQVLRQSEERLNFTLHLTHTGGWELNLLDGTGHRTLEHDRIFGYDSLMPNWTYEIFLEHVLPDDRAEVDRRFREATATQSEWNFECRIRRFDGKVRWIWVSGQQQCDTAGHPSRMFGIVQDITERKQEIEDSRRFFALSQEPLCVVGFDGYFKSLNLAWEKTLGYTLAEILTKPLLYFLHPDDRQATQNEIERHIEKGDSFIFENRYLSIDGSCRWFSWIVATSIQDQLFYCAARDITARKEYEAEQKRLHERAQLALDAGLLGDWSWNATTDQVSLGHLASHIIGLPEGISVTRAQLRERLNTEDAEQAREAWDRALIEHTDYRNEHRMKLPDGYCWIAMTGRGNYAEDGTVLGMNGVMQDINERKLAELARLRLAAIVESSDDAIISKDLQGIITSWNAGAERLFGYSAAEIIGQPITRLMPTQLQIEESNILAKISRGIELKHFETVRLRKDGSCIDVSVTISPIKDASGTIIGASKVARDITDRKVAELKLLEAMAAAEKANFAKSNFLSSMSHELRTPLNAILGFAQLLESSKPPPTSAQTLRIEQIIKAGWYLLELINEILDLALIESGKVSLSRESVSLISVIQECQAMMEPQAQQRDIKLTFRPFDNTWFVYADRTRLKQVLINLLSNAIKYNREHGTIEVSCSSNTLGHLRISIKDSGSGLSTEHLTQLFQPFNRLGQEYGSEEGTGIGLVVTKQLVELMSGSIGVESTVGVGSEFWIKLIRSVAPQLDDKNTMLAKLMPQAQKNTALHTLLYVEDNPANLLLVEQIIEGHSQVNILSASDGKLGIALARTHLPNVILMDINLPGISGTEALKILRQDPETRHIPVIALSANAMPHDIEKGLKAGFYRYLTKPIKIDEFMDALDDALKLSKTQSSLASTEEQHEG